VTPPRTPLGPPPRGPVAPDGQIAFGTYSGTMELVDWSAAAPNRLWRFFHWKRWQYGAFIGPDFVGAVAIADVGFATTAFAYLFDRRATDVLADVSLTAPRSSGRVADHVRVGARSAFSRGRSELSVEHHDGMWVLRVRSPALSLDARLAEGPSTATICAVARVPGGRANCSHKTHGLEVTGRATVGDREIDLAGCRGSLDHTSGLLARDTSWRWASGSSDELAMNLVEGFQEPLENAVWRSSTITPLPAVRFQRASAERMTTWSVHSRDGLVDLSFRPEGIRSQDKNLVIAVSRWIQPIGTWTGTIDGKDIGVVPGVLEDHVARW
jgi:hypothetical protein